MKKEEFDGWSWALLEKAERIQNEKGPAYTFANEDVLTNFKTVATRLNLTPLQVWGVYAMKHFDAISSYAGDTSIPQAEDISGRFADAINYLKLGYALVMEERNEVLKAEIKGEKLGNESTPQPTKKLIFTNDNHISDGRTH